MPTDTKTLRRRVKRLRSLEQRIAELERLLGATDKAPTRQRGRVNEGRLGQLKARPRS